MSEVQFTTEGIPPLPDSPDQGLANPTFAENRGRPSDGIPIFELVPKKMADGSFRNVEYVSILTPGDPKAKPRHKVTDALREKYHAHYQAWRKGMEVSPVGTPLEMWPYLTPAPIAHLKTLNIFTVEQLRDCPDANLHQIPMGRTMKNQAREWLESKKGADVISRLEQQKEEALESNRRLEDQILALQQQVNNMAAAQVEPAPVEEPPLADALDAAIDAKADEKPKRGRPKKETK